VPGGRSTRERRPSVSAGSGNHANGGGHAVDVTPHVPSGAPRWDPHPGWLRRYPRTAGLAIPAALGSIAIALGAFRLGAKSLWIDEAFSDAMARIGFPTFWEAITRADAFHGLYYAFLHLWIHVFGDGEQSLRAPSLIAGGLTVVFVVVLTRRLFGARASTIAGVLIAINTFFISYEQEARDYALVALASVVATLLFVRALERPSRGRWLAYGTVAALAIYIHAFAGLVVVAHLLSLPLRRSRPRRSHVLLGFGTVAMLVAPLVTLVAATDSNPLSRNALVTPHLRSLELLFLEFSGGNVLDLRGKFLLVLSFLACCGAMFLCGRALMRRRAQSTDEIAWRLGLVTLWLAVPVAICVVVSIARPIFLDRYLMSAFPALGILAAVGISSLPTRVIPVAIVVMFVGLSFPSLRAYYDQPFKWGTVNWRAATDYVLMEQQEHDGVIFATRYDRRAFEYYLRRSGRVAAVNPVYPAAPWGRYTPVLADLDAHPATKEAAGLVRFRRVWLVRTWGGWANDPVTVAPLATALTGWLADPCRKFGPVLSVCLYSNPSK
jgi:mannosyltransferase